MNKTTFIFTLALTVGLASSLTAHAALIDRGGGLIYDTDLDITWMADANYAQTSGFDADGAMNWTTATTWAAGLVYGGYDDWRLPATLQPDPTCSDQVDFGIVFGIYGYGIQSAGFNCTGSELGHLFYTEGGLVAGLSILSSTILDDYFINMQSFYWSGTELDPLDFLAWGLSHNGYQSWDVKPREAFAWAVRSGDVATVPEPASLALLGLGLAGLGLTWWRPGASRREAP